MWPVAVGTAALAAWYAWEEYRRKKSRLSVPIRVQVNGTRGKSSVVRLLAGALREAGISTLAKVTGTAPYLIAPDGSDGLIRRRGPARIKEQLWALNEAARLGCRALVVECMAVDPELQWIAEQRMIQSTLGIITNVRADHQEVMGRTPGERLFSLANTIPWDSSLVVGDPDAYPELSRLAAKRGTRAYLALPEQLPNPILRKLARHEAENWAVAALAAQLLGVDRETALTGMSRAAPEPSRARLGVVRSSGSPFFLLDALACNDVDSAGRLVTTALSQIKGLGKPAQLLEWVLLFHHRRDRPERARSFGRAAAEWAEWFEKGPAAIWITGDAAVGANLFRHGWNEPGLGRTFPTPRIEQAGQPADVLARIGDPFLVIACGNTHGVRGWPPPGIDWRDLTGDAEGEVQASWT